VDHKRVAEIHIPNIEGGTGYLIKKDLVLTAYHVVKSMITTSKRKIKCDIRFLGDYISGRKEWLAEGASLYWFDSKLDLALLKLTGGKPKFISEVEANIQFGLVPLMHESFSAKAIGFPIIQKIEDRQNPEPVEGTLNSMACLKEGQLRLNVTSPIPEDPNEWAGISGAPVFIRNYLIGVIVETNRGFKEKALMLTPISLLENNQKFCKLINNLKNTVFIDITSPEQIYSKRVPRFADNLAIQNKEQCDQLIEFSKRTTINQKGIGINIKDFVEQIPNRNLEESDPLLSVILTGHQGAGKTTFLSGLYAFLESKFSPRYQQLIPLYINLNDFVRENDVKEAIRLELMRNDRIIQEDADSRFILMVDGLSVRDNFYSKFLTRRILEDFIGKFDAIIWSITDGFEKEIDNLIKEIQNPNNIVHNTIQIRSIEIDDSNDNKVDSFLKLFIAVHNRIHCKMIELCDIEKKAISLKKLLQELDVNAIDQYILSIVYHEMDIDGYRQNRNLTDFILRYCHTEFNLNSNEEEFQDVSFLAYKMVVESFYSDPSTFKPIEHLRINEQDRQSRYWTSLVDHKVIRDFLALRYVIKLIEKAGYNLDTQIQEMIEWDIIGYDFPRSMNTYARDLIGSCAGRGKFFIKGINNILKHTRKNDNFAQTNNILCYFLGRCTNPNLDELSKLLEIVKSKIDKECGMKERIQLKTQYRTIAVSFMRVGRVDIAQEFLLRLLNDKEMASIDRGYHRIYYGDTQPYKDKVPYCYLDDDFNSDWSKSYDAIKKRILDSLDRFPDETLNYLRGNCHIEEMPILDDKFDVSTELQHYLLTLALFVQSRSDNIDFTSLPQEYKYFTLRVLKLVLKFGNKLMIELRQYFGMVKLDIEADSTQWNFIAHLYRLKWTPRSGWLKRNIENVFHFGRIESVADHTLFAVYLAKILLPDSILYNKQEIINTLTFHDVLEAYTGDFIPYYMDDSQKQEAQDKTIEALNYIRYKDTYPNIYGTDDIYRYCSDFSKTNSQSSDNESGLSSINIKIARDIDKLENLIQLYLYRNYYPTEIIDSVFLPFENNLVNSIHSELIKNICGKFLGWLKNPINAERLFDITSSIPFRDEDLLESKDKILYPDNRTR